MTAARYLLQQQCVSLRWVPLAMLVGDIAGRQCEDVDELFEVFCPLFFRNVVSNNNDTPQHVSDTITTQQQHIRSPPFSGMGSRCDL